ncbi:MAG TPA: substrate-binding domain-containing protein [Bacteroidota bacterium]|nr:substrate-binding domain-containing protein [Bacteroidota bacterium]
MKYALTIMLIAAMLALSCGRKAEQPGTRTIGVALLTRGHIFYKDLEEGFRDQAKADHFELVITSAEFDLGKQIGQIEDFVARKVDAVIVCPVDSKGIGPGVRKANEAGIPVFTADIAAQEGTVVSHIASDNVAGGRLAGEYMATALGGRGRIAIINDPVATSVLDRVQGFREAIARHPGLTVVADVNGEAVRDKSLQATTDVLQGNPRLDGIFGINDASALGALDAVQQFKRTGIVIVGYDATGPAADAITRGTALKADVIQYPKKIGTTTIDMISDYFAGKKVPPVVPIEVGIADSAFFIANPAQ